MQWNFFLLKMEKELYKTDKEQILLNRIEDIDNRTWYFVSMLKLSFEVCCTHWTLLMLRLGSVDETRMVSLPAWRFDNLGKRANSVERRKLILIYYFLNFYSRFQTAYIWRRSFT